MKILVEALNSHTTVVGMRINATKANMMSAFISDEQRQGSLFTGEPLEEADKP